MLHGEQTRRTDKSRYISVSIMVSTEYSAALSAEAPNIRQPNIYRNETGLRPDGPGVFGSFASRQPRQALQIYSHALFQNRPSN